VIYDRKGTGVGRGETRGGRDGLQVSLQGVGEGESPQCGLGEQGGGAVVCGAGLRAEGSGTVVRARSKVLKGGVQTAGERK
jgi:hypothetical protein